MSTGPRTGPSIGPSPGAFPVGHQATPHPAGIAPEDKAFFSDRLALQRQCDRAATTFGQGDVLHREVARRLIERLGYVKLQPVRTLDLGCATGAAAPALRALYPKTCITGVDFAPAMVRAATVPEPWFARWRGAHRNAVCADMSALPLAHASFGLVFSNLALHWLDDPAPALREVHRVLELGGLFMFSMLGPDTLFEVRDAWASAQAAPAGRSGDITLGASNTSSADQTHAPVRHVKRFIDLHDIGDLLVKTGFSTPVMDMEKIVLTYRDLDGLVADLRATGSTNAMCGRPRGLTGRQAGRRLRDALDACRTGDRLPVTFEVIYGHAWKAPARRSARGEEVVRFVARGAPGSA